MIYDTLERETSGKSSSLSVSKEMDRLVLLMGNVLWLTCWSAGQSLSAGGYCERPNGSLGVCKNLLECKTLLGLLMKQKSRPPQHITDFLKKSHCGFEGIDPIVCCPLDNKSKEYLEEEKIKKYLKSWCDSEQTMDKILGGTIAFPHEFPWMALIRYKTNNGLEYRCGGSLISPRFVLTAAHCVSNLKDISPVSVRLGVYDIEDEEKSRSGIDVDIEKLIPHPQYLKAHLVNDVALIRLSKEVNIGKFIRPVCLPISLDVTKRSFQEKKAVVAGFGTTESGTLSRILRKVTVPLVSNSVCSRMYDKQVRISSTQVCAGGESGKDSCAGDSGGPLHLVDLGLRYVQHGIVSFGPRFCGTKGVPGVYTKVSSYLSWIVANLKPHNETKPFHFNR